MTEALSRQLSGVDLKDDSDLTAIAYSARAGLPPSSDEL
jgi:hypothetical protein